MVGMQLIGVLAVAALWISALETRADEPAPHVGDQFAITRSYQSSERSTDNSMASARGSDTLVERVVGNGQGGLELEYDLPSEATAEERARNWQFPARILKPAGGPMRLLNPGDLEARVEAWLKAGGLTRADCERWIFTWNAFRISCDPQSVIQLVEAVDLRPDAPRAGASYQDEDALSPGRLESQTKGPSRETLTVEMEVNPQAIYRERAEADVAVGEIMQKPVTLEEALQKRAKEHVSGTISVMFEVDTAGMVHRRRKVTRLETRRPDGHTETRVTTQTVERRRISARAPPAG